MSAAARFKAHAGPLFHVISLPHTKKAINKKMLKNNSDRKRKKKTVPKPLMY